MVESTAQVDRKLSPFVEVTDLANNMNNRSQALSENILNNFERIFGPGPPRGLKGNDKIESESNCEIEVMQRALSQCNMSLAQLEEDLCNLIDRL